jgi:hypothetical protein
MAHTLKKQGCSLRMISKLTGFDTCVFRFNRTHFPFSTEHPFRKLSNTNLTINPIIFI